MQRTGAVCQKAAAPLKAIGVTVSEESIRAYLEDLNHRGRREETVRFYAAKLKTFYDYLPPDKQIVLNTLETWRQALLAEGYAPATVNTNISAANGLLDYLGRRDLQLTGQLETETAPQSELTRTEYLRLLSAARALEKERTYLLVKAIALTGAHVGELPQITVEAVQSGRTPAVSGSEQRRVQLPRCLQAELLSYCRRQGLTAGPVFVTRSRRPLRRTQVTGDIQSLSGAARVAPEKCNPRCLRKLYLVTQAEIDRGGCWRNRLTTVCWTRSSWPSVGMSCQNRKKRPNRTSGSRAITAETGQVGSITPSGRANVSRGGDRAFHIMAGDGYRIFNVLVDGESVGAISHYTFENVRANHTIKVVFKATQPIADPDNTDVSSWLNTRDHTVYLDGFTGGSFAPGRQMTRGQAAQMFYNLLLEKNVSITDTLHRCSR